MFPKKKKSFEIENPESKLSSVRFVQYAPAQFNNII